MISHILVLFLKIFSFQNLIYMWSFDIFVVGLQMLIDNYNIMSSFSFLHDSYFE